MQVEAGGDEVRVRHNTRKRDLDTSQDNPSSKRRLTTGAPGHDESTSNGSTNNSSFNGRGPQVDAVRFSLRSSGPPVPQKHGSLKPPTNSDSAARLPGLSGPTGGHWGAHPSGLSSGLNHHKATQSQLPGGPPTSSTSSSDASSIPARSTEALTSFHSLRYGYEPEDGAAREDDGHNVKPNQEVKGRTQSRRHGATGKLPWQSKIQDDSLPVSRLNGTRETPQAIDSSDDDSYVEEKGGEEDSGDDAIPTTRQRSARLRDLSNPSKSLKGGPDIDPNDDNRIKQGQYEKTPSGKDYHKVFGRQFPCPVRTCPRHFKGIPDLEQHFKDVHSSREFNNNLDEDGSLEYVRRRTGKRSIVGSQEPRHPTEQDRKRKPAEIAASKAPKGTFGLLHDSPSHTRDAKRDSASANGSELDRAMAESQVWAYVAPLVPKSWAASITDGLETSAFIQAISLPMKNDIDMEWLAGTKGSHQRLYRALMSVVFQVVGVVAHCTPCDSKIPERRRNCKVLPPEAAGMRELQQVCGSQCVNCFFFQASRPCGLPGSSITNKQTPVPVPVPPLSRPTPVIERPLDSPPADTPRLTVASRPFVPPYSLYKAQKREKPISESPVPVPSFVTRGPSSQSQSNTSDVAPENPRTKPPRRSNRVSKADGESDNSIGVIESYAADEAQSRSVDPALSNDGPSKGPLTSGRSNTEPLTEAASSLHSDDITTSRLASRMFSLFGDIGELPAEEQATLWSQMQQMSKLLKTGDSKVSRSSSAKSPSAPPFNGPSAAADKWEIAPGMLIVDDKPMAFSTSFLSREAINVRAAQQLSPNHRILNKSIPALHQLTVGPEEGWKCTFSVIRGVIKIRAGDVEARIGQGGLISVEKKCIITNISHKEARVQVCWVEEV